MGESQHGHVALFIHGFVCAPASSCASRAALTCVVPRRVTHRLYSARQMELGVVRIHIMPLHPTLPPTLTAERKQNRKKSTPSSLNKFMGMKEEGNRDAGRVGDLLRRAFTTSVLRVSAFWSRKDSFPASTSFSRISSGAFVNTLTY